MRVDLTADPIERVVPAMVCDHLGAFGINGYHTPAVLTRAHCGLRVPMLYTRDDLVLYEPSVLSRLRADHGVLTVATLVEYVAAHHVLRYMKGAPRTDQGRDAAAWATAGFSLTRRGVDDSMTVIKALNLRDHDLAYLLMGYGARNLRAALTHRIDGTRT